MRIIVNGQQAFGQAVLERLLERDEEVVAVYCGPDQQGRPPDPLKATAEEHGIPVYQPTSFKRPDVWDEMRSLEPDLAVMAYVTLIVPQAALDVPRLGTIQYHPSLLPDHRGPSSINWPIIFGKKKTGLSIFWPDDGLDTGPILLQKEVEIGPDDTLGSIYFNHLFPMGVDAMIEAVDLVREGNAPKLPQDPDAGSYEGWCRAADAEIDWSQPIEIVHNLVRGTNPQPGAWTRSQDKKLNIYDCERVDGGGAPGEVSAVDDQSFTIAAAGGALRVLRVRPEGAGKIAAGEFAASAGLKAGAKLG
jgi:methionyl-tRNA formyltransferase